MKKIIIDLVLTTLLGALPFGVNANQIAGMDLTLTHISGDEYQIRLALYRDCAGMDAPATAAFVVACTADSTMSFNITGVPLKSGSGNQTSTLCPCGTWVTTCNGGTYFGLREYIYETQVTLPPCNHWRISYSGSEAHLDGLCCRFPANTINNPTAEHAYIELTMDNLNAPGASTPTFWNAPGLILVQGFTQCITLGSLDPNGDSLTYEIATPMTNGYNGTVSWVPPYSAFHPFPSVHPVTLDPVTGNFCASPAMPFLGTLLIKINKWRRINNTPILIGTLYRDAYFAALPHFNQPPVLSGMDTSLTKGYDPNDTLFTIDWSAGDTLRFVIWGYDPDVPGTSIGKPDIFSIYWDEGIPLGTFQAYHNATDSAYAIFTWVPDSADAGTTHSFIATIRDHACYVYEQQSYTYRINVRDLPVGVEKPAVTKDDWSIAPVPFTDRLQITLPESFNGGHLVLFDMQGKRSLILEIAPGTTHQPFTAHTSSLKPGIYQLQLESNSGDVWRQKVLKSQ
jgi:hypothetical protein